MGTKGESTQPFLSACPDVGHVEKVGIRFKSCQQFNVKTVESDSLLHLLHLRIYLLRSSGESHEISLVRTRSS